VAEWSPRRTRNQVVPGSPEIKSSATLVNNQLVCLWSVGILNNVMFNLNYLFQLFARPTNLCAVDTMEVNNR